MKNYKMTEPTIVELLNQIELMKQALFFYGNENNYQAGQHDGSGSFPTMIDKDGGHQARFVLEQIQKTSEYASNLIKQLDMGITLNDLDLTELTNDEKDAVRRMKLLDDLFNKKKIKNEFN